MGSSTSKSIDRGTPVTHRRSCSSNVFQTSCIRPLSGSPDSTDQQVSDNRFKEACTEGNQSNMSISNSKGKTGRNKKVKMRRGDKRTNAPSEPQLGEWGESSLSGSCSSSRFLSRFSFFPGSKSSRSSKAYQGSSSTSIISNDDVLQSSRYGNKTKRSQGCEIFPSCFLPTTHGSRDSDSGSGSDSDNSDVNSIYELGRNGNDNGMESNRNLFSRAESREPVEQNVRFSRTLSVGRLRDRVLHRPPFPELASFQLQSEREVVDSGEVRANGSGLFDVNVMTSSTMANSLYGSRDFEDENVGARETRYANLLEHRSNFLERRRRIRSQVHALQRMGSRFENISGHERSCIMSGQHRTGHCTCRLNNQDPNDSSNARGSISRIVLLAESLFEVFDQIHQQSVVSSSQPALSSIGSVPAPIEVVEALPVKLHRKLPMHLNEEDAQCYICLHEYEDGDEVRVLPCHHEFHRLCIDKWLKEIHRICPLCRGDVCKTCSATSES